MSYIVPSNEIQQQLEQESSNQYKKDILRSAAAEKIKIAFRKWRQIRAALLQTLLSQMEKSQIKIARTYRRYLLRKLQHQGLIKARIYWNKKDLQGLSRFSQQENHKIYLAGNFTSPQWKVFHKMNLSSCQSFYYLDVALPSTASFKFIEDGFINNIFFNYGSKTYFPHSMTSHAQPRQLTSSQHLQTPQKLKIEINENSKLEMTSDPNHCETYQTQIKFSINTNLPTARDLPSTEQSLPQITSYRSQKLPRKGKLYNIYDCKDKHKIHEKIKHQQKAHNNRPQLSILSQSDLSIKISSTHSRQDSINEANSEESFVFVGDAYNIPKNKNSPSEDAFFCHEKGVGVSDGVGGWNSYGIDCSFFSRSLMKECQKFVSRVSVRTKQYLIDPRVTIQEMECHRQALETSMESLNSSLLSSDSSEYSVIGQGSLANERNFSQSSLFGSLRRTNFPGSATATICVLNNKDMTALNLGDSGFILFRFDSNSNEPYMLIKSKEQLHGFNTPFQLTKLPTQKEVEQLRSQHKRKELSNLKRALKEKRFCDDAPEDSDIYQVRVREGDLLLLATDGVFDNLFIDEILGIVRNLSSRDNKTKQSAHIIAKTISEAAHQRSKRNQVKTPFSMKKAQYIMQQKNKARQGLMSPHENKEMKQFVKENGLDEDSILVDNEFEDLCIGKGKADDITTAAFWIKQNKRRK